MKNTSGLKRDAGPGRPKGSRNRVPASFKASLFAVFDKLESEHPELFEQAVTKGLQARPPASFQYLQLWAHYREGKPAEKFEGKLDGTLRIAWEQ